MGRCAAATSETPVAPSGRAWRRGRCFQFAIVGGSATAIPAPGTRRCWRRHRPVRPTVRLRIRKFAKINEKGKNQELGRTFFYNELIPNIVVL